MTSMSASLMAMFNELAAGVPATAIPPALHWLSEEHSILHNVNPQQVSAAFYRALASSLRV